MSAILSAGWIWASPHSDSPEERRRADELRRRLSKRDRALEEVVLEELLDPVRGWALRLIGPGADADDVAMEALSEIADALRSFRGQSTLGRFARRITLRVANRHWRRRARRRTEPLVQAQGVDPHARLDARDDLRRLYNALGTLPEGQRTAFLLCGIEGLTPTEAARAVGTTANLMRVQLHRARKRLEVELGLGSQDG